MIESIQPPDVPRLYLIPVDALYSGLRYLFADVVDVENNQQDAEVFAAIFQSVAIHLVQKSFAYQQLDPMVIAQLQYYGIQYEHFVQMLENIWKIISTPIEQIERAIAMLRYHYIVDVNYQLTDNRTLQVTLITTLPSRNYSAVLREEILKARENDEFVPYKYLILAGLA